MIFTAAQSPELFFWMLGPPTAMLFIGASFIWAFK